jgi:hypothetical protein
MTAMIVVFLEVSPSLEMCRCRNVYFVPKAAHQCIPDTAPARMKVQPILLRIESVQAFVKTEKRDRAAVLAEGAMTAAPTTLAML